MTTVLEEVTEEVLSRAHVESRLDEWARRIDALYAQIEAWLPAGWTATRGDRVVRIHEGMMREVDVPARDLPVLEILKEGTAVGYVEPRVLWIVGANGRLKLVHEDDMYFITDRAEIFESPQWQLAPLGDRDNERPLDQAALRSALR